MLYYQPLVNTVTGQITQMEALLRWHHPEMGMVSPARFIPLAEENGLIIPIGEWVMRTACAQTRKWHEAGLMPIRVAVNLSAQQFRHPDLVSMIGQILKETRLDPEFLELEITETTVITNVESAKTVMDELTQMGISIAMDDFGNGYSSLSYLKKFPFHTLKIDQAFVRDITTDPNDRAIVTAIAALGKVLNLKLVAEGVETDVQERLLRSLNCHEMQGYLFSAPLPAPEATRLLQNPQFPQLLLSA
jgi:EAL domain-containing protein (putative c-di-GMP-specific phosphodiesterase class I)